MFTIQTVEDSRQREEDVLQDKKNEALYKDCMIMPPPGLQRMDSTHESTLAIEGAKEPWMQNVTLSVRNLMGDNVDPDEACHMALIPGGSQSLSPPRVTSRRVSLGMNDQLHQSAFLGHDYQQDEESDSRQSDIYPRYRRLDHIVGHEDVQFFMEAFHRRQRHDSIPEMTDELDYSASFVAEQEEIMSRIQQQDDDELNITNMYENGVSISSRRTSERHAAPVVEAPRRQEEAGRNTITAHGSTITIRDQDRVYAAIDNGTAKVLKCVGCPKHLMATNDVKLVFCPGCGTISPVDLARVSSAAERTAVIPPTRI